MRLRWLPLGLVVVLLVVPAAALTVARVVQPPGGAWVRLVAFTPYALPLYLLALLLLAVAWARGQGRWRPLARALAVVALAGAVMHAAWVVPAYVGSAAAASDGSTLRVMTANLMLGQASAERVVQIVRRADVDVLVLEEVDRQALARLRAAGLEHRLPYAAGRPAPGAAGTMVLARRPVRDAVRLATELGSYQVRVAGVTLVAVHPRPPTGDVQDWVADHRAVRRAAYDRPGPAMIVGDFNATTDHQVMRELAGRGWTDAATSTGARWQPTWPSDNQVSVLSLDVPPLLALDHVLVNSRLRPVSSRTFTVDGTDHRALVVEVAR